MRKSNYLRPVILAMLIISCCLYACKCNTEKKDPYANVAVNPAFTYSPPVATHVSITQLDKPTDWGNLLYEATLPKEKIKANMLAVLIGDSSKIVLHDDGINGDRIANDGIFSTVMNVSIDSLRTIISEKANEGRKLLDSNKTLFKFSGRLELPASGEVISSLRSMPELTKNKDLFKNSISLITPSLIHLLRPVTEDFKHKSLTITDPSVVNDPSRTFNPCTNAGTPGGAWTFGKLMTDMATASGVSPETFVTNWLNTWTATQTVNHDNINARSNISGIISTWHTLSGGAGVPLNVNKAPFKLLAIINRFDLRSGGAYGGGNAGEGRFVFCATDANCNPIEFFVIFEYGVNKTTCSSIHAYAQQWIDLASMPMPGTAYNTALQNITDQFATANTNPSKPNGNSLDQLRTNEIILGFPWELREFHIDASSHQLINVSTKREPQENFNGRSGASTPAIQAFGDFVNANIGEVMNDKQDFPDNLTGGTSTFSFIAGHAHTQDANTFHWDAVVAAGAGHINNDTARFHISLNTCSGCHGGETITGASPGTHDPFTQIGRPLTAGGPATLSKFLTGDPAFSSTPFLVADRANRPAGNPIQWPFNDLERRGRDLIDFASSACFTRFHFPTLINEFIPPNVPVELTKQLTFNPTRMSD